jgi:hypothetical protein
MTPTQALKRYQKAPKGYRNRALVRLQDVNLAELQKTSKYKNRRVVKAGESFDSKREYLRHLVLLDMQKRGEITNLQRQVPFDLMVNGVKVGKYIADWTYTQRKPFFGFVIDDCKGVQTPLFVLKWKMLKAMRGEGNGNIYRLS